MLRTRKGRIILRLKGIRLLLGLSRGIRLLSGGIVAALMLLILGGAGGLAAQGRDSDRKSPDEPMAEMYIRRGAEACRGGSLQTARELMDKSRSFSRKYSDPLLVEALFYLENRGRKSIREVLELLEEARRIDRWVALSADDVYLPESRIAYQLGDYGRIIRQWDSIPHSLKNNPVWYYRYLRSLYHLGRFSRGRDSFQEALRLFPGETRWYFPLLDAGRLSEEEKETWYREIRQGAGLDQDEAQVYMMRMRGRKGGAFLASLYREKFGEDPFLRVYQLLYGEAGSAQDPVDMAEFPSQIQSWQMARDFYAGRNSSGKGEDWSGFFVIDRNIDGFPDGKALISGGQYRRFSWDRDQDDRMEWVFHWDQPGSPAGGWYLGPKGLYHLTYREYPHGGEISIYWGEGREMRFYILPSQSAWPLLESPADGPLSRAVDGMPRLRKEVWNPQISRLMERSFRVEDYEEERLVRYWKVEAGQITAFYEDTLGDGRMDHILYIRGGEIVGGRRDLNQDGEYGVFEVYREGRWIGAQYDQDGNGEPEYYEEWEGAHPQGWDKDRDGRIDILQLEIPFSDLQGWSQLPLSAEEVYDWDFDVIQTMQ